MIAPMIAVAQDTAAACTVTPSNAGFYHAAYVVIAVLYGGYAVTLWLRRRSLGRMRSEARAGAV